MCLAANWQLSYVKCVGWIPATIAICHYFPVRRHRLLLYTLLILKSSIFLKNFKKCDQVQKLFNRTGSAGPAGLGFDEDKCKSQRITRKSRPVQVPYILNESPLTVTPYEKDLGIWVASDLTWSKHITEGCAKANKLLSFLCRTTLDIGSVRTRRTLYLAVVRPALGYATQVWFPQTFKLIEKVERIQRRATKYILGLPFLCAESYKERLLYRLPLSVLLARILRFSIFLHMD